MKPRLHLFVAAQRAPFGEALLGMRIAHELHARGDRIAVLAGDALSVLTEGTPFQVVELRELEGIDRRVAATAMSLRASSIVLLDATSMYILFKKQGTDASFAKTSPCPVLGLDVWNARETGLTWDVAGETLEHSPHSLDVTKRLIPVPFAKAGPAPGFYNALPGPVALSSGERDDVREGLGLGKDDRLVFLTSARWQEPAMQASAAGRRLAEALPLLIDERVARLGKNVHVVHVGPEAYPMKALGARYTWMPQRSPARFTRVLAASDLLLSFNFSATTIVSAIASSVPVLLGVNSYEGEADAIAARLPERPSDALRKWLKKAAPLYPFRVWPLGFWKYLAPLATDENRYTTALRAVEVLDEPGFLAAMSALLGDARARADLQARQEAYRSEVMKLPAAAELVSRYLSTMKD